SGNGPLICLRRLRHFLAGARVKETDEVVLAAGRQPRPVVGEGQGQHPPLHRQGVPGGTGRQIKDLQARFILGHRHEPLERRIDGGRDGRLATVGDRLVLRELVEIAQRRNNRSSRSSNAAFFDRLGGGLDRLLPPVQGGAKA